MLHNGYLGLRGTGEYLTENGYKSSNLPPCAHGLSRKTWCRYESHCRSLDFLDHATLRNGPDGRVLMAWPYMARETLETLAVAYAARYALDYEVGGNDLYGHGTTSVVFRATSESEKLARR